MGQIMSDNTPAYVVEPNYDNDSAADFLGVSPRTIERWRIEGKGPTFCKFGKRVVYKHSQLIEYQNKNIHTSTSKKISKKCTDNFDEITELKRINKSLHKTLTDQISENINISSKIDELENIIYVLVCDDEILNYINSYATKDFPKNKLIEEIKQRILNASLQDHSA